MNFFQQQESLKYKETLQIIASLSKLFSENNVPFLHYRIMENLFCDCFNAENLSRSDSAYDAKFGMLGIGLKTFICKSEASIEKIAEFNKDSKSLKNIEKEELAIKLAKLRNDRIEVANNIYGVNRALYHIIARKENKLIFFETDYEKINTHEIKIIKDNASSLSFLMVRMSIFLIIQKVFCNENSTFQKIMIF